MITIQNKYIKYIIEKFNYYKYAKKIKCINFEDTFKNINHNLKPYLFFINLVLSGISYLILKLLLSLEIKGVISIIVFILIIFAIIINIIINIIAVYHINKFFGIISAFCLLCKFITCNILQGAEMSSLFHLLCVNSILLVVPIIGNFISLSSDYINILFAFCLIETILLIIKFTYIFLFLLSFIFICLLIKILLNKIFIHNPNIYKFFKINYYKYFFIDNYTTKEIDIMNFTNETPENIEKLVKMANNKTSWETRMKALEELALYNCQKSRDVVTRLALTDKVYAVKREAFKIAQAFGITKQGKTIILGKKNIKYKNSDFTKTFKRVKKESKMEDFDLKTFKEKFLIVNPEMFDVMLYEKKEKFDEWIENFYKNIPEK